MAVTQPTTEQRAPDRRPLDQEPLLRPARGHDGDALLARLDGYLATVRSGHSLVASIDVARAERVAETLRSLIADTALASAADRALVRAAVHCFVSRAVVARITANGGARHRARLRVLAGGRPARRVVVRRSAAHDLVLNALLGRLGRPDLALPPDSAPAAA